MVIWSVPGATSRRRFPQRLDEVEIPTKLDFIRIGWAGWWAFRQRGDGFCIYVG